MSRSPEMRRIERAIEYLDQRELQWALGYVATRKRFLRRHSDTLYRLEKRIEEALVTASEEQ